MKPKAFLDLAERLLKDSKCEASLRTCVSRSYYALFNSTEQFVRQYFPAVLSRSAEDHEKVYAFLNHCGVDAIVQVASDLNDLRDQRNDADYKLDLDKFEGFGVGLLYKKAGIALQTFEMVIGTAKGRNAIIKGMESYKKLTNS
jgi:uncharacterized protein (UPF0332 family)